MAKLVKPLHLACVFDDTRPNFKLIHVKNGVAAAMNGHILIKLKLEETTELQPEFIEAMEGKYIHMEVWADMCKADLFNITEDQISCCIKGVWKTYEYSQPNGEFFSYEQIIDDIRLAGTEEKQYIAYTPKLINIIDKIFGTHQLVFSFSPGNKGTLVYPFYDSGMMAVLMPAHVESETVNRFFI